MSSRRYLFVLGHMRSYSSLLCHILGSHAQIDGYCETHVKYRSRLDLLRLRSRVVKLTGERLRGRYVLDKVLHNYPFSQTVARSSYGVVLVRRPAATVQSIVNMGLHYSDVAWYREVEHVARYYEERLAALVTIADQMRGRVMYVEAETLLARTPEVLQRVGSLLELSAPLRPDYRRFAHTGEGGYGDPSETIREGRISKVAREPLTPVILPVNLAARLEVAYAACTGSLRDRCEVLAAA